MQFVIHRGGLVALAILFGGIGQLSAATPTTMPAEYEKLATDFGSAIQNGDAASAGALFNMDAFRDRVTAGVTAPPAVEKGFRDGASISPLFTSLAENTKSGGTYHLLRTRDLGGKPSALFRVLSKNNAFNYNEWYIEKDRQGNARFVDIYIAATGELFSQTMRRSYIAAAAAQDRSLLDRLLGREKDFTVNLPKLSEMGSDLGAQNWQGALDIYKTLPESLQHDKTFMIMRFTAAVRLEEKQPAEYEAALADFKKYYPDDPCLSLMGFDSQVSSRNFPAAYQTLDALRAFTGGDAYLDFLQGSIHLTAAKPEDITAAKESFQKSMAAEPTLKAPYWGMVSLSLRQKDFQQTAATLDDIQNKLHVKIGNLEKNTAYAEFLQSDAGQKWTAAHTAPAPTGALQ